MKNRTLLIASVAALWAVPSLAQTDPLKEAWSRCEAGPTQNQAVIEGCTAVINSGKERGQDLAAAHAIRASAMADKGEFAAAAQDFTEALRLDPAKVVLLRYNRGVAYSRLGDRTKAIADFDEVLHHNPNMANAYVERGIAYAINNDLDRAIADFTAAMRLEPNAADNYMNRGNAYDDKGNLTQALADYARAIELDPNYGAAYYNRGKALIRAGRTKEGEADLAKARSLGFER